MQNSFLTYLIILFIAGSACSCSLIERSPDYAYKVYNNTSSAIAVKATLASPYIIGNTEITEFIGSKDSKTLWIESGEKGETVIDYEKDGATISAFKVINVRKDDLPTFKNYLESKRWIYKKENLYRASYTLTVDENDF